MLCPPLPWTSPHSGAFLLSPTKMMRSLEGTQQHQLLLERCPPAELHGALDALTQLGNCAWRVNGRVLDLVLDLFRDKGCPRLGVPAPPTEAPRPPEGRQTPKGCLLPEASPADKAEMQRELARRLKVAREMQSLRADALYRLSLAQHLRNHVFWLPHNMDFRGRTYPCSPHFNHLGSDLARALLEFAQGRPLGPHGLDWLKIHLINLTGLKKRESLQTRRDYADAVMEDILDSAERPMTVGSDPSPSGVPRRPRTHLRTLQATPSPAAFLALSCWPFLCLGLWTALSPLIPLWPSLQAGPLPGPLLWSSPCLQGLLMSSTTWAQPAAACAQEVLPGWL